ncbi:hypothetical protein ScPMuIL_005348 [Solemya velum]
MFAAVACVVVLLLVGIFYRGRRTQMQFFKKLGLYGPAPNFIVGNILSFWNKTLSQVYCEWKEQYGETYGYFEGPTPVIVSSNLDLLHQVFVKRFKSFYARKVFPVQVDPDKDEDVHMFFARGERWRRLRSIVNPAFSTPKMRMMAPMINKRIDSLMDVVNAFCSTNKEFESHDLFQRLTLDTIANCGFGLDANSMQQPDDSYLKHCRGVISDTTKRPLLFLLGFSFPNLRPVWIRLYNIVGVLFKNPAFWLEDKMRTVINKRKTSLTTNKKDLLELMINAEYNPNEKGAEIEQLENNHAEFSKKKYLSKDELRLQCLLFLLAGYETTSTSLAYIMYELTMNPNVQATLQQEIDTYFPDQTDELSYDVVTKMEYLDMVWCETLRKYPLASSVTARQCMETSEVNGLVIEKDTIVQANVWDIHYDPEYWGEDTHTFDPLRFTLDKKQTRHPMAWMPFGGGPRTCVGLRLAQIETKMAIVRLFKTFSFLPSSELRRPLKLVEGATILPVGGVKVKAIRRSSLAEE